MKTKCHFEGYYIPPFRLIYSLPPSLLARVLWLVSYSANTGNAFVKAPSALAAPFCMEIVVKTGPNTYATRWSPMDISCLLSMPSKDIQSRHLDYGRTTLHRSSPTLDTPQGPRSAFYISRQPQTENWFSTSKKWATLPWQLLTMRYVNQKLSKLESELFVPLNNLRLIKKFFMELTFFRLENTWKSPMILHLKDHWETWWLGVPSRAATKPPPCSLTCSSLWQCFHNMQKRRNWRSIIGELIFTRMVVACANLSSYCTTKQSQFNKSPTVKCATIKRGN